MAGQTALIFGTKKSLTSAFAKSLSAFFEKQKVTVFLAENPKDCEKRIPFNYAVLVSEEKVPPPTLNVWFKAFAADKKPSERLFLLSKAETPAAWQENLPIEASFEESNYKAVLQEIINPGLISDPGEFSIGDMQSDGASLSLDGPAGGGAGLFESEVSDQALSLDSSESPAQNSSLMFSSGDLSKKLSLNMNVQIKDPDPPTAQSGRPLPPAKSTGARPAPPPPSAAKAAVPPSKPSLQIGKSAMPTAEVATKMAPLPQFRIKESNVAPSLENAESTPALEEGSLELSAPIPDNNEHFGISLEAEAPVEEPSVQFDLNAEPEAEKEEDAPPSAGDFDIGGDQGATRVSNSLEDNSQELPVPPAAPANKMKLALPEDSPVDRTDGGKDEQNFTSSILLEQLQHPEGTRLNEPLAGRGEEVDLQALAIEAESQGDEPLVEEPVQENYAEEYSSDSGTRIESNELSAEPNLSVGEDAADEPMVSASSGASKSEVKTLEKYLAIKDRELRERESNIKILKGQIQKIEAKLQKSDEARRAQALKLEEAQAEIRALREESEQKAFALQKVEDHHREEMKALQARMDGALFEANKASKRLDEFRERVKQDIQKIRAQERELANKLEIQKRDADALLGAKDEKLMAQRREIDQLQFELDNMKERLVEETEKAEERSKRLARALSSLKLAQGMLSGIKEEVVPTADSDSDGSGEAA